jgi:hypothetical protein
MTIIVARLSRRYDDVRSNIPHLGWPQILCGLGRVDMKAWMSIWSAYNRTCAIESLSSGSAPPMSEETITRGFRMISPQNGWYWS